MRQCLCFLVTTRRGRLSAGTDARGRPKQVWLRTRGGLSTLASLCTKTTKLSKMALRGQDSSSNWSGRAGSNKEDDGNESIQGCQQDSVAQSRHPVAPNPSLQSGLNAEKHFCLSPNAEKKSGCTWHYGNDLNFFQTKSRFWMNVFPGSFIFGEMTCVFFPWVDKTNDPILFVGQG